MKRAGQESGRTCCALDSQVYIEGNMENNLKIGSSVGILCKLAFRFLINPRLLMVIVVRNFAISLIINGL